MENKFPVSNQDINSNVLPVYLGNSFNYKNQRDELLKTLSAEEKIRATKFASDDLSFFYIVPHYYLRKIISEKSQLSPGNLNFVQENGHKPWCPDTGIDFNISHAKNLFAIVLADTAKLDVGVDIEIIKPIRDIESLVKNYMHPKEEEYIFNAGDENTIVTNFYKVWTRKEALLKMLGVGIAVDMVKICAIPPSLSVEGALIKEYIPNAPDTIPCYLHTQINENYIVSVALNEKRIIAFETLLTIDLT